MTDPLFPAPGGSDLPLVRFGCGKYYLRINPRLIGFTASSAPEAVSIFGLYFNLLRLAVLRDLTIPNSSFLARDLFRVPSLRLLARSPFGPSFNLASVSALVATSPQRSHIPRRIPFPRYVASAGFLNLSTLCSALGLAGLFHPAATSRVSPVQGLLSSRSHPSSSEGACPHAVEPSTTHQLAPAATVLSPRLRGLYPREVAFAPPPLFTTTEAAPLIEFVSSRPSTSRRGPSLPGTSAHDVDSKNLRFRARLKSSSPACPPREASAATSPRRPPARGFEPTLRTAGLRTLDLLTLPVSHGVLRSLE